MSSNELVRALSNELEDGRYQRPSVLTTAGRLDRQNEDRHVLALRDCERILRERIAHVAAKAAGDIAEIQARGQVRTEAKYALHRARRESQIIGEDDPELQVKYAILDDDQFAEARCLANGASGLSTSRLF